jgi:hypothetical protein
MRQRDPESPLWWTYKSVRRLALAQNNERSDFIGPTG